LNSRGGGQVVHNYGKITVETKCMKNKTKLPSVKKIAKKLVFFSNLDFTSRDISAAKGKL
jgi:hypothetical protein